MKPDTPHTRFRPRPGSEQRRLALARVALTGYFFAAGAILPVWASRIPAVKERTGVDTDELGVALLALGLGALVTMRLVGGVLDRFGARHIIAPAAVAAASALVLPGLARGFGELAAALFVLGSAHSLLNVSVNTQAAHLQRVWGRPILASFHAFVSLGGCVGAVTGVITSRVGLDVPTTFQTVSVLLVVLALALLVPLLVLLPAERRIRAPGGKRPPRWSTPPRILFLGMLALSGMLAESAVQDWSALYSREAVNASDTMAATAFAVFTLMMTLGRLAGDRLTLLTGPVTLTRGGALLAAVGLSTALAVPHQGTILVGFGLVGVGLSCVVPQIIGSAADHDPTRVGRNLGSVSMIGYLGPLLGAPCIGALAGYGGLAVGLALPVLLMLVIAAGAGALRPRRG